MLEDESRRRFASLVPESWVIRPAHPDYGIDDSVEVFDKVGDPTGLMFFIQVKATGTTNLHRGLKIVLKKHTVEYFRTLELPVMVVRYHRPTGKFFWQWFHELKKLPASPNSKTMTITIPSTAEWKLDSPETIEASLKMFRQLKSIPTGPIEFVLSIEGASVNGMAAGVVRSLIMDEISDDLRTIVITSKAPKGAHPFIRISAAKLEVNLAGLRSVTFVRNSNAASEKSDNRNTFPHDVLSMVACVFSAAGFYGHAADIAAKHLERSTLFNYPDVCSRVLQAMAATGRADEALRLAKQLIDSGKGSQLTQALLAIARLRHESLTSPGVEYLTEVMQMFLEKSEFLGATQTVATAHYNLGNHLRGQGGEHMRAAFKQYRAAARLDPNYRQRSYFWQEIGGILFGLSRYRWSATSYRRAHDLGANGQCLALLADALMMSGEYKKALEYFRSFIQAQTDLNEEWDLKKVMLSHIVDDLRIEKQKRNPKLANQLADMRGLSESEVLTRLDSALEADALCALAWYNRAGSPANRNATQDIFVTYLFSAVCAPYDIEAWSLALLNSLNSPDNIAMMICAARMAYRRNGHTFLDHLEKFTKERAPQVPVTELMNLIGEAVRDVERGQKLKVIRLLGNDANFKELRFDKKSTSD